MQMAAEVFDGLRPLRRFPSHVCARFVSIRLLKPPLSHNLARFVSIRRPEPLPSHKCGANVAQESPKWPSSHKTRLFVAGKQRSDCLGFQSKHPLDLFVTGIIVEMHHARDFHFGLCR